MIFIIYEKEHDISTLSFLEYCKENKHSFASLSLEDLLNDDFSILDNKTKCIWKTKDQLLDFNHISGIYLRNINFSDRLFGDYRNIDRLYAKKEWFSYFIYAMSKFHNCINKISTEIISSRISELPFFLNCAKAVEFNTPNYVYSTSFNELEELFYKGNEKYIVMQSLIPSTDFRSSCTISENAIGLVQYIKGKPIFVHIIGSNIFAFIYQKSEKINIELDDCNKSKCLLLCQKLDLTVAQIILIEDEVTKDKYFINLSVYPNWNLNNKDNTKKIFDCLYKLSL